MEQVLDDLDRNDVIIVGEYTTSGGPICDDWFIVIVCKNGDRFDYPISFADELSLKLETKLDFQLANRTNEASRIIFPEQLKDKPIVEFRKDTISFKKILFLIRCFGIDQTTATLSKEAQDYVEQVKNSD